jgi:hypothetical protein
MLRGNNIKIIMPEELCMESSVNFEDLWMIGEELVPVRVI